MDLFLDGLAQVLEFGLAAESEDALDDATLPIEQDRIRQPAIMVYRLHASCANEYQTWRPEFANKRAHLRIAHVIRSCRYRRPSLREVAIQLGAVGHAVAARG